LQAKEAPKPKEKPAAEEEEAPKEKKPEHPMKILDA